MYYIIYVFVYIYIYLYTHIVACCGLNMYKLAFMVTGISMYHYMFTPCCGESCTSHGQSVQDFLAKKKPLDSQDHKAKTGIRWICKENHGT